MATDPNIHPYWAQETKELADNLDEMDYFQILGVEREAPLDEIKDCYHSLQRTYHPDTFYSSPDEDLKKAVFKIAKRLAEAYVVLKHPGRRERYLEDIKGRQRAEKLRFNEEAEKETRQAEQSVNGRTPQGRNLVNKALKSIEDGDLRAAERDLKTALLFESKNTSIKRRLTLLRQQIKEQG